MLRHGGKTRELTEEDFGAVMAAFSRVTADARTILSQPYDPRLAWERVLEADKLSVADHLAKFDLSPLQRVCLESVFSSAAHNSINEWSYMELIRWTALAGYNDFLLFMDSSARFKLKDGTGALINAMLEDGQPEVRLSATVSSVEEEADAVVVRTASGETIITKAVICTVPMNVLPEITFTPALDEAVVRAGKEGHNGVGFKLFANAKGDLGSVFCFAEESAPLSNLLTYASGTDHTLLVGFGSNSSAIDLYDKAAVQASIRDYLPGVEIESTLVYDWLQDPYSRGTWASYKPGWMSRYYHAIQQDKGRVLFASGDHGDGWRGFIDGAIAAGSKAAARASGVLSKT